MKKILLTLCVFALGFSALAQDKYVENGGNRSRIAPEGLSASPDAAAKGGAKSDNPEWMQINTPFSTQDIYGASVNVADTLAAGKAVVVCYDAAWNGHGWRLHRAEHLRAIHNQLGSQVCVLWVECESQNTTEQILGTTTSSSSQGDWTHFVDGSAVPYRIIDCHSCQNMVGSIVNIPDIYFIAPNGYYCKIYGESWGITIAMSNSDAVSNIQALLANYPRSGQAPTSVSVTGHSAAVVGETATFTVHYSSVDPITNIFWAIPNGTPSSHSGLDESIDVIWNTTGTKNVYCIVTNANGSVTKSKSVQVISWDSWGDEMDYTNGGESQQGIGYNNNGEITWGVKYPAALLTGRNYIEKVSAYIGTYATGNYDLTIYQGGDNAPSTQLYSNTYTVENTLEWEDFVIPGGLAIDPTQNLWVVFHTDGISYPASYTNFCGDPNGSWMVYNGTWTHIYDVASSYEVTWMIKTTTSATAPAFDFSFNGPETVLTGVTANFTITGPSDANYIWALQDGNPDLASGTSVSTYWDNAGTYTVMVIGARGTAEVVHTKQVTVLSCDVATPWEEGFENTLNCWTVLDEDGDGYTWDINPIDENAHGGSGFVASASYINNVGAVYPDNWLISPRITLPVEGDYSISWWDYAEDSRDYAEHYGLYVSTTGTAIEDFHLLWEDTVPSGKSWRQLSQSLNAYRGQQIHIAFRHFNCTDQYWLLLDDIKIASSYTVTVTANNPAVGTVTGSGIYAEGSDLHVTATVTDDCYELQHWVVNGEIVEWGPDLTIPNINNNAEVVAVFANKWSHHYYVANCGPYYWDKTDKTYNKSGLKFYKATAEDGCPIRDTLDLTIVDRWSSYTEVTNCGSYTWDKTGQTYNKSGMKFRKGTADDGCPIRDTLALTIVDRWSSHSYVENCGPYTWDKTGQTYNKSGLKFYKGTADDGCPIRDTLELTITDRIHSYTEVENCGPYTWDKNGQTYNKSGMKFNKGTTESGCLIRDTLVLTITDRIHSYTEVTNCGPYTWDKTGQTYNKSGMKFNKGTTESGCLIRDTLVLTIVDRYHSYTKVANCGPYTWDLTGSTYNKSGLKFRKGTAADGCPIRDTLELTVVDKWSSNDTVISCNGSYTWDKTGQTYKKTGLKFYKGTAADGCPIRDTLYVIVSQKEHSYTEVTNCGPYTWVKTGQTYNKSGMKFNKGTNEYGCPVRDTLNLTILNCKGNGDAEGGAINNSQLSILNSQLSIYPNPTTGMVKLNVTEVERVEVMDLVGRRVAVFENTADLDLTGLTAGTYTLRVTMPEGVAIKRVVKN